LKNQQQPYKMSKENAEAMRDLSIYIVRTGGLVGERLTMLKFVLARQQYKKRNRKALILNVQVFFGK
jgi:hypothetical protein